MEESINNLLVLSASKQDAARAKFKLARKIGNRGPYKDEVHRAWARVSLTEAVILLLEAREMLTNINSNGFSKKDPDLNKRIEVINSELAKTWETLRFYGEVFILEGTET